MKTSKKLSINRGEVRIIAGQCRGRKIRFPNVEGLRPTPNRLRETLFNWLAPVIPGANCLDLFAGSGALSFEAMSRGASSCVLLDSSTEIISALVENRRLLNFSTMQIIQATFPYSCEVIKHPFDIIFLDPPFHKGLVPLALQWLREAHCLKNKTYVYVETESVGEEIKLDANWQWLKDQRSGKIRYCLLLNNELGE